MIEDDHTDLNMSNEKKAMMYSQLNEEFGDVDISGKYFIIIYPNPYEPQLIDSFFILKIDEEDMIAKDKDDKRPRTINRYERLIKQGGAGNKFMFPNYFTS
jgi:hypothetical protein